MTRATSTLTVALFALLLGTASVARANPTDLFGFGARGPALGNAMVAADDPVSAAVYNPAGAALAANTELAVGYAYGALDLDISGRDPELPDAHGMWAAATAPFSLARHVRLAVSSALYLPDQWIARVQLLPVSEPHLVLWDNRPHRIVFNAVLAARFGELVSIGAGATFFANAVGRGIKFRVDALPGRTRADADLDAELPLRAAPTFGLLVTPGRGLRFGARYTEELALDVQLAVVANAAIPGTMIEGEVDVDLRGVDYFTPRELVVGGAWDVAGFTFSAELAWQNWAALDQVASDVTIDVNLGIDVPIVTRPLPPPGFSDVFVPRVGVERRFDLGHERELALRGGYSFVRSPVPEQTGTTSFADADRHMITLGAGFTFHDVGIPLGVDLALSAQLFDRRETHKSDALAPGGDFTTGGAVYYVSIGARTEL